MPATPAAQHTVTFDAPAAGLEDTAAVAALTLAEDRPRAGRRGSRTVRDLVAAQHLLDELRAAGAADLSLTVLAADVYVIGWR